MERGEGWGQGGQAAPEASASPLKSASEETEIVHFLSL